MPSTNDCDASFGDGFFINHYLNKCNSQVAPLDRHETQMQQGDACVESGLKVGTLG